MSNVLVNKDKIDILANAISIKSGEPLTLTLDEMVEAVDGIEVGVIPTGNIDITQAGVTDVTNYATATVPSAEPWIGNANRGFFTENGQRKWHIRPMVEFSEGEQVGWMDTDQFGEYVTVNAVPSNTTITPTESSQTVGGYNYMMEGAVTVSAIPSTYVGSGITQRSSSDLTASGATVTVPSGYYSAQASKTVPSAEFLTGIDYEYYTENNVRKWHFRGKTELDTGEGDTEGWLAEGTYYGDYVVRNAVPSGTTITPTTSSQTIGGSNYIMEGAVTVSAMPSGTAGTPTATKGTVSNHSVSVTPSVTNTEGYISGGTKTGTAVTVSASELASGNKEITSNGTNIDVVGYSTVSVNVSGGGGSSVQIGTGFGTAGTPNTSTLTFTNLAGEPTSYAVFYGGTINTSSTVTVAGLAYDGTNIHGQGITNTNNAQVSYLDDTYFTASYSSGTLTITASNCVFSTAYPYGIFYSYGGSSTNIGTENVQVGSGATSITFTGLTDEPEYWSCIFKSNFSTSSGYQRVIEVVCDGTNIYGLEMDSSAKYSDTHWSYTYNNGSLTITSQGTNAGGYFHQPGYYQLTYAVSGDQSLQTKTVTPTTSTQNVEADQGYTALKKVVVNPIPSSYVQPTATQGATTYRASTTQQTIASGTYLSGTQTIAPVSQTNLTAENIKSGTTISISNGQSNIWSVTGTYSGGGGGGGATIDVKTITPSSNVTSLSFDVSGKPIMFVVQMNKNNSYINGSSTRYITSAANNGETVYTTALYKSGSTGREYTYNTSSWSYSNGTLTITSGGGSTAGYFTTSQYRLIYAY